MMSWKLTEISLSTKIAKADRNTDKLRLNRKIKYIHK